MIPGPCAWPSCQQAVTAGLLGGLSFCRMHHMEMLRERILRGPEGGIKEDGTPPDVEWVAAIARFVELAIPEKTRRGLSQNKISRRTYAFEWTAPVVKFSVQRHPAGFVYEQRWRFDAFRATLRFLSEHMLSTELKREADGTVMCPKCESTNLNVRPGAVRCEDCGYTLLHEHSDR